MGNSSNKRRSVRLQNYDYSSFGSYFITICAHHRECLFGEIVQDDMELNSYGQILYEQWLVLPERFQTIEIDGFVVMPNHTHAIISIAGAVHSADGSDLKEHSDLISNYGLSSKKLSSRIPPTVGNIVGAYKSLCVHHCLEWVKQPSVGLRLGRLWQRNYHEHVIRNQHDYDRIAEYIQNNPKKWQLDSLHPDNIKP